MADGNEAPDTIDVLTDGTVRGNAEVQPVSTSVLGANLRKFVAGLGSVLEAAPSALHGYALDEIEVSITVSAEGGVSLLGIGGKAGSEGGLKLTFKRA